MLGNSLSNSSKVGFNLDPSASAAFLGFFFLLNGAILSFTYALKYFEFS